jgi:hypothetical protein
VAEAKQDFIARYSLLKKPDQFTGSAFVLNLKQSSERFFPDSRTIRLTGESSLLPNSLSVRIFGIFCSLPSHRYRRDALRHLIKRSAERPCRDARPNLWYRQTLALDTNDDLP